MSRRGGFLATGFLTIASSAGWAPPTVAETLNTNALWVADRQRLLKFSPQGSLLLSITAPAEVTSLAVDPLSGAFWVGARAALSKYAPDGSLLLQVRVAGTDSERDDVAAERVFVAMDPVLGRPWVAAGGVLISLEADGRERFRRSLAEEITGIAYNGRTRQAWVLAEHEILLFGDDGASQATLAASRLEDVRIATDSTLGTTWVATKRQLLKYDGADQEVLRVSLGRETRDLAVNSRTGEVWVTQKWTVVKLSTGGQVLQQMQPFGSHGHDDNAQPRHLAVDPSTGSLWVASRHSLARVNRGGAVVAIPARFHEIRTLGFFADLVPPKLEIVLPPSDAFASNAPTVKLRYSDSGSGIDPASLKVKVDTQDVTSSCGPVDGGSDCVLRGVMSLAEGLHTVWARIADRAGNVTEASASFTVDTIPPPAPNTAFIDVEATDDPNRWQVVGGPESVEALSTVQIRNARTGASVSVTAGANGSFSLTLSAERGDLLAITATDRAGNTSPIAEKLVPLPFQPYSALSVGASAACAVLKDGTVSCWGRNHYGELGLSGVDNSTHYPGLVARLSNVVSVGIKSTFACALTAGGEVKCWGSNGLGELGDETTLARSLPASVHGPTPGQSFAGARALSVGDNHSCVVDGAGIVYCWGANSSGQLGDGSATRRSLATAVSNPSGSKYVAVAVAAEHSCALTSTGNVYCWGANTYGQLNGGKDANGNPLYSGPGSWTPILISSISNARAISAGDRHNCALLANGTEACWGEMEHAATRTQPSLTNLVAVAAGGGYTCALNAGGQVYCWGSNLNFQLGSKATSWEGVNPTVMTTATLMAVSNAVAIATGPRTTCVATATGQVQCWGGNFGGEAGNGRSRGSGDDLGMPNWIVDAATPYTLTLPYTPTSLGRVMSSAPR